MKRTAQHASVRVRRRPPVVRIWSGPLISRPAEPADEYLDRLRLRLADPRAHLYFDASFLMWMAKTSAAARAELLAWLATLDASRVHVPLWAAHEFFKHRLKRTVANELSAEVTKFDAAATSMFEVLGLYASNELFGITSGVAALVDEYRRAVQPIRSLLTLAAKSTCLDAAVQEVAEFVDRHLLPGPLDQLIADVEGDERVRNRGAVPPAFKDAHKRQRKPSAEAEEKPAADNSFGDLVFWREILRHSSASSASATLVLSNDRKNDWFENQFGDEGFPQDLRKVVPRPRPVPRAHPLLIREAFDRGAGELLLLDSMYCAILFERMGVDRQNFTRAALAAALPEIPKKKADLQKWADRFGPQMRPVGEVDSEVGNVAAEEAAELEILSLELAAPNPELHKRTRKYLGHLRGDAGARGKALGDFSWEALAKFSVAEIVAVGRGIFSVAEMGDVTALSILSDLREQAPTLPTVLREAFYFGALSAAYFDDELVFRPQSAPEATDILLDLVTSDLVATAVGVIGDEMRNAPAVYVPATGVEPVNLEVVIVAAADGRTNADLVALRVGDLDLMTNTQDDEGLRFTALLGRDDGAFDTPLGPLMSLIARYHRIPRHVLTPSLEPDSQVRVAEYAGVEVEC